MSDSIAQIAANIAKQLASYRVTAEAAYITTPLTYVGGSPVVVRIDPTGPNFFVSDAGIGAQEASLIGGSRFYKRIGEQMAARFGVLFDQDALFEANTPLDELVSSVIAVANASKGAVDQTAFRLAEKAIQDVKIAVKDKLYAAFSHDQIITDYAMRGGSNDEWQFDAAVRLPRHLTLIQVVTPSAQSIASAVARFIDMSDLPEDTRPHLVGALQDRARTPRLKLLQRSANIIDLNADPRVWQRAAA